MATPLERRRSSSLKGLKSFSSPNSNSTASRKSLKSSFQRLQSVNSFPECLSTHHSNIPIVLSEKVQVHVLDNDTSNNFFSKFFSLRTRTKFSFPNTWDYIEITINDNSLTFHNDEGLLTEPLLFKSITQVVPLYSTKQSFYGLRITSDEYSFLMQTSDAYQRDRWLHSLQWKRDVFNQRAKLSKENSPKAILHGIQNLINMTLKSPLLLECTRKILLDLISSIIFQDNSLVLEALSNEEIISALAPLASSSQKSEEMCDFFIKHCRDSPRSRVVIEVFTPMVQEILKYTSDFGKAVWLRTFVSAYIEALYSQNNGKEAVKAFINSVHGPLTTCSHLRVVSNLGSVCLSAIYHCLVPNTESNKRKTKKLKAKKSVDKENPILNNNNILNNAKAVNKGSNNVQYEKNVINNLQNNQLQNSNSTKQENTEDLNRKNRYSIPFNANLAHKDPSINSNLLEFYKRYSKDVNTQIQDESVNKQKENLKTALLFADVLIEIAQYNDWLPALATLLQPVPFPEEALNCKEFIMKMSSYVEKILNDERYELTWFLISTRNGKKGWVQLYGINGTKFSDNGVFFNRIVEALKSCATKIGERKMLATKLYNTQLDDVLLLALREDSTMITILCMMLEYELNMPKQMESQIVTTLKGTDLGSEKLKELLQKRDGVRELDDNGGPTAYSFPPLSTDRDLAKFLMHSSNSNLESLNLSFTFVTDGSAELIANLSALKHLNLWSSNIKDEGLQKICEKLNLTSLNMCETKITDNGIRCLRDMTNLVSLNLNSTGLSKEMHQNLLGSLPQLEILDITYTDADY